MNHNLKITKVEAIPFGVPVKGFTDAYTDFTHSNAVLVKIHANDGTVGFGEASALVPEFYGETLESITSTIEKYIAPRILGQHPLNVNNIMVIIDAKLARITCAKEGIDLALNDLAGKILNIPVYALLGGALRDRIPAACEIGIDEPDAMAQRALEVIKIGFKVIKLKGSPDFAADVKRIRAVREAIGEQVGLRLDPNSSWTTVGTIKVMKEVEDCHLQYLEQPIPSWDLKGMAHIRESISIPLMADESIWTPQDVIRIAECGAADIINIKIAKSCGLVLGKKIEAVAEAVGLPCVAGSELEPGFSSVAKLHFAASMKIHPFASEFTELSFLKENILKHQPEVVDGCIEVPQGPGFGVELNEEVFERVKIRI